MPARHIIPIRRRDVLRERLDALVATFDISTISPDPLELVRRYDATGDQEVAGQLAAAFAYGRADIVVRNVGRVLEAMGPSPHAYLAGQFEPREASRRFAGFSHRFHKERDLVALLECLAMAIRKHGSLGRLFELCWVDSDRDVGPSIARYVGELTAGRLRGVASRRAGETSKSLAYLLTSPEDGSACKRMNLFLRWMVRRESPDLGIWAFIDPSKLVIPLDTHVHRIAAFLGLTKRKSADWKTARALTDTLAQFDPRDPVRYDFALCRLGILDLCSSRRRKENCDVCQLRDVCRFPVTR